MAPLVLATSDCACSRPDVAEKAAATTVSLSCMSFLSPTMAIAGLAKAKPSESHLFSGMADRCQSVSPVLSAVWGLSISPELKLSRRSTEARPGSLWARPRPGARLCGPRNGAWNIPPRPFQPLRQRQTRHLSFTLTTSDAGGEMRRRPEVRHGKWDIGNSPKPSILWYCVARSVAYSDTRTG
jgi:hypothetical protein